MDAICWRQGSPQPRAHTEAPVQPEVGAPGQGQQLPEPRGQTISGPSSSLFSECFRGRRAAKKEEHSEGGTVESGGKEEIKSRRLGRPGRRRQEGEVERARETSQH